MRSRPIQPKTTPIATPVNSPKGNDYAPVISADGSTLFYAAKDRPDNIGGEDVFLSRRKGSKWSPATIEMDLSHTYGNEAPVSITIDGTSLLLFQNGLLYRVDHTANGWKNYRLPDLINSSTWQADATIAANGRLMLWAASGRTDREADTSVNLYASLLDSNGLWGEPFELGPAINTPFDERSPYLHPDMHTLYFCSEGHGSLGQMDLYMSVRLSDNSWTHWSQPVNIGKEFNTTDDDWGYKITTDGTTAYYAQGGRSQDIYTATLPKAMRPQPVTIVTGTVLDRANRPVSTQICWENPTTGQLLGQAYTDPATGRYYIVLPKGKTYNLFINDSLFLPGGTTGSSPTLLAQFYDEVGINAFGSGIGHDITATIDGNPNNVIILNDFYESSTSDFRNGSLRYTLRNLIPGHHSITVKAWNIYNYSASATIDFCVRTENNGGDSSIIGRFITCPNPASIETRLQIEHNAPDSIAEAVVMIYSAQGQLVRTLRPAIRKGSYVAGPAVWNFCNEAGAKVAPGLYIARVTLVDTAGRQHRATAKIMHRP